MPFVKIPTSRVSRAGRNFVFLVFLTLVSAASFDGYFSGSGFRDTAPRFNLTMFLDGTAYRPYIYRQLIPAAANLIVDHLPQAACDRVANRYTEHRSIGHHAGPLPLQDTRLTAKYLLVYYISFAFLMAAIYCLYRVCLLTTGNAMASLAAAFGFALIFPLFMTDGGFFYDHGELFFFAAAYLIALRGNLYLLPLLAIPAAYNKESFLFFLLCLIPVLRSRRGWRPALISIGASLAAAAAVGFLVKRQFAGNPGGATEWHFADNVKFYFSHTPFHRIDAFYGILMPRGFNLINLLFLVEIVRRAWRNFPAELRQATVIGLVVNIPLFILFGFEDEVRSLSMLYVPYALLIAYYLRSWFAETTPSPAERLIENQLSTR